jgi:hypothetical protein
MQKGCNVVREILQGALAGLTATVPMTGAMELGHRRLPRHERYPLPPRQITMKVANSAGIAQHFTEEQKTGLTLVAHFAYGASMGALYGLLTRQNASAKTALPFGLAVWAGSYLGLLPGLGILKPATQHPLRRNALMIGAHVVWGLSLAGTLRAIQPQTDSES